MTAQQRLTAPTRIFLDTAPIIYFVEAHPIYLPVVESVFRRLDEGSLLAMTSPVTLAECLIHPIRKGNLVLADGFIDLVSGGPGTVLVSINGSHARTAAELRATHNLTLTDAFQLAIAIGTGCDIFLTNDVTLKRVSGANVVTVDDLRTASNP
jgi:predicted nucleic acid-binding protein